MSHLSAVILAAGHGTRMKSDLLKVLHPIGGKPMLGHVVDNCRRAGIERIIVVVGFQQERVRAYLGSAVSYVMQEPQLGTGHAVLQARRALSGVSGNLLVIYGDNPLVGPEVINRLVQSHTTAGAAATLLTARVKSPGQLGRIVRDEEGRFVSVVEHKDANPAQLAISEIASGIYVFSLAGFFPALKRVKAANAQGEYYLPDVMTVLQQEGRLVQAQDAATEDDVLAPNDRRQLARAEGILRIRVLSGLMDSGVSIVDPDTTWVGPDVRVGRDSVLFPSTYVEGDSVIGSRCSIGPGTRVVNCVVGDGTRIEMSVVEESQIGPDCQIGPFAHVRPGCELAAGVQLGNYAEIKKSRLGAGVKMHHHSYVGDADVGNSANIGAGVITCNYDGVRKHPTVVEEGAFIGTNVNLVAPIRIGKDAYVAAGSTVNQDVPADALAIARPRQENKPGYVSRLFGRLRGQTHKGQEDKR